MLTTICLTLALIASVIANIAQACEVGALRTLLGEREPDGSLPR